jgi:hypothetical protein
MLPAFVITLGIAAPGSALALGTTTSKGSTAGPAVLEPTTLSVTLQSSGQSGAVLTVSDGARVSATAQLVGLDASISHGPVSYRVFSDPSCATEVASAGVRRANQGIDSRNVRLTPGTYYWQASFAGDAFNGASVSNCGAAVETVAGVPLPSSCMGIAGRVRFETDEGPLVLRANLSSDLGASQRLYAWWPGTRRLRMTRLLGGWCVATPKRDFFRGVGDAKLDGVSGYVVHFTISVSQFGEPVVRMHVRSSSHELVLSTGGQGTPGGETLD